MFAPVSWYEARYWNDYAAPQKPLIRKHSAGWLFLLLQQVFGPYLFGSAKSVTRYKKEMIFSMMFYILLHQLLKQAQNNQLKGMNAKRLIALLLLIVSLVFFVLGFKYPLLQSGFGIGPFTIKKDHIYISTSFRYFFEKGEVFIGLLLLFFTIILLIS